MSTCLGVICADRLCFGQGQQLSLIDQTLEDARQKLRDITLVAEQFRLEQERAARERVEWPRRLEKLCREAEAHWRAAHPWVADPNMCVSVPIPRLDLPD
jgi:hypothetical protein